MYVRCRGSGYASFLWSWRKSGRHGSGHHVSRWNTGSATCGMDALGERPRTRLELEAGWSREAWKGVEWSAQSSWGWFTPDLLPQQQPGAMFPHQAAAIH